MEVADSSVELLREFERTGRPEPFEIFMRRHASMVYATCLKVTRDPHDAEDATQATFLTLASKSRLSGEIRQPEAWLRKVAHRLSLDLIRSKKRRVNRENLRSEMTSEEAPLDSHDHADKGEVKGILNEELAKLPASYRMPLILHYFGGLSRDEMAAQLKLKPSTLGVRLHRAREQLRRKLAARGILLPAVALTALLTEVVRSGVCSHMMSSTARQASAIALGGAPPMMMASTGIDSLGSLLGMLAHGKLKVMLTAAVALSSAISLTSARVQQLLPESIRNWLPTFRMPTLPSPRFETPVPALLSQAKAPGDTASTTFAVPLGMPGLGLFAFVKPSEGTPTASSTAAMGPAEAGGRESVASARLAPTTMGPFRPITPVGSIDPYVPPTPVPTLTPAPTSSRPSWTTTPIATARPSAPTVPDDPAPASPRPAGSSASNDPWNDVIAERDDIDSSMPGPGVPLANAASPAEAETAALPERVFAAVSGPAPALPSGGGGSPVSATSSPVSAGIVPQSADSRGSSGPTLLATRTTVFTGTSANYGGYADGDWQATELTDLSNALDQGLAGGYLASAGPGVPGESLSINGARVTLHDTAGEGALNVSFVDTGATQIPDLPDGHHFIGVWQLECHAAFTSADLLVRYDDLRAARLNLNEQLLKLWVSDGETWTLLWTDPSFGRDVNRNLLWVTTPGDFEFFAVSAPEPATLVSLVGMAAVLAGRRRR